MNSKEVTNILHNGKKILILNAQVFNEIKVFFLINNQQTIQILHNKLLEESLEIYETRINIYNLMTISKMFTYPTQSISLFYIPTNVKTLLYFWFSELICELVFVHTTGIT